MVACTNPGGTYSNASLHGGKGRYSMGALSVYERPYEVTPITRNYSDTVMLGLILFCFSWIRVLPETSQHSVHSAKRSWGRG